ncbi:MAG: ATP-dependent helicase/deoxyribonuclease subunit B [Syntrophorhabdus sp. PtaB.Bin047]|nr:MAG: ATP-dependent helicase/deoxyribonuclease subunit B [Syntrophorhabdus sp. PtaB.Bin047]
MSVLRSIPFASDIIEEVAGIVGTEASTGEEMAVVFPGKRPTLYLKARLASLSGRKTFFPPRCFSLDEFIDEIARRRNPGFADIDHGDAAFVLFGLIRSLRAFDRHAFARKGFGDFLRWAGHLLNFIDRLDMEGIDNSALANVERNASIGYDVPQSVNELLSNISLIRSEFHRVLAEGRWFTRGTKRIAAVEETRERVPDDLRRIVFAGLFGLTGGEREVLRSFWDAGQATVLLSGDPEDWPMLKDLVGHLKAKVEYGDTAESDRPAVSLHAGHDTHAEVLEAYRILEEAPLKKTAIILPDADPLFPLLSFVADRTELRCNVSLAYPMDRTPVFDLTRAVLAARVERRAGGQYPSARYLAVILHPFIKNLEPDSNLRSLIVHIERSLSDETGKGPLAGRSLVTLAEIEQAAATLEPSGQTGQFAALLEVHRLFFRNFEDLSTVGEVAAALEEALEAIVFKTPVRSYVLSGTIFESILGALGSLKGSLFSSSPLSDDPADNTRAICDITLHHLESATLPFDTHPVEELEIIGMLESRNLSFERVIILDVNEGVLPGPREVNPVIPIGVFETLGIPSPEFTEAIYRYNFYRLTGSAGEVHLVYRNSEDRPRSRYIEEVLWAEERSQGQLDVIPVRQMIIPVNLKRHASPPAIEKTDTVLRTLTGSALSPSTLDTYVRCPLLFYFTRLMGLEERKTFSGDIEATDRGNIIHRILSDTFSPYIGLTLTKESEDGLRECLQNALETSFKDIPASGEYYLFKRIAAYKLDSFLRRHMRTLSGPVTIECLEEAFRKPLEIRGSAVTLYGRIDRVDRDITSGRYTVYDYKTGTAKQYPLKILEKTDFGDILSIHDHVPSFQLPVYIHIFSAEKNVPVERIDAALILLGNNTDEVFLKGKDEKENKRLFDAYTSGIETVVSHMLDPDQPFEAFDTNRCADCTARDLCHV